EGDCRRICPASDKPQTTPLARHLHRPSPTLSCAHSSGGGSDGGWLSSREMPSSVLLRGQSPPNTVPYSYYPNLLPGSACVSWRRASKGIHFTSALSASFFSTGITTTANGVPASSVS